MTDKLNLRANTQPNMVSLDVDEENNSKTGHDVAKKQPQDLNQNNNTNFDSKGEFIKNDTKDSQNVKSKDAVGSNRPNQGHLPGAKLNFEEQNNEANKKKEKKEIDDSGDDVSFKDDDISFKPNKLEDSSLKTHSPTLSKDSNLSHLKGISIDQSQQNANVQAQINSGHVEFKDNEKIEDKVVNNYFKYLKSNKNESPEGKSKGVTTIDELKGKLHINIATDAVGNKRHLQPISNSKNKIKSEKENNNHNLKISNKNLNTIKTDGDDDLNTIKTESLLRNDEEILDIQDISGEWTEIKEIPKTDLKIDNDEWDQNLESIIVTTLY